MTCQAGMNRLLVHNKNNKTYYIMNGKGYISEEEGKQLIEKAHIVKDTPVYTSYRLGD